MDVQWETRGVNSILNPAPDYHLYTPTANSQSNGVFVSSDITRNGDRAQPPFSESKTWPKLEAAVQRSQDHLLSLQKPEGYWVGELIVDSTLVSDMIAFHHWDGK